MNFRFITWINKFYFSLHIMNKTHKINIALILLYVTFLACKNTSTVGDGNDTLMKLCDTYASVPVVEPVPYDTIYSFHDEFPVGIESVGEKLFLTFAMQDTTIKVIDMDTKVILRSLGHKGSGPEDVISPVFFYNRYISDDSCLILHDTNARKLIHISLNDFSLKKEDIHASLHGQSSINYFNDMTVSYMTMPADYMFSIHNNGTIGNIRIAYPFDLNDENKANVDKFPTYLAQNINVNRSRDRIIVSMYYFDAYYVYNLDGNIIGEFHLSDCDFNIDRSANRFFNLDQQGYIRYTRGYGNDRHCYLRRIKEIPDNEQSQYIHAATDIVKVDWNGNPVAVIKVPDGFNAFCVNDHDDIIAIVNTQLTDESERYDIVRFILP